MIEVGDRIYNIYTKIHFIVVKKATTEYGYTDFIVMAVGHDANKYLRRMPLSARDIAQYYKVIESPETILKRLVMG